MEGDWHIDLSAGKPAAYAALRQAVSALLTGESNRTANLANAAAALFATFGWHWVGFYLVDAVRDELVLGPFQGPVACTRLRKGKGVCAAAWEKAELVNVPDVDSFPGHVACSSLSKSEIVIPVVVDGLVVAVLDIDAAAFGAFDAVDEAGLAEMVSDLESMWMTWE